MGKTRKHQEEIYLRFLRGKLQKKPPKSSKKGKNPIKMFEMLRFNNIDLIPTQPQDIQDLSQHFLD